jgi:serine/threonine protein kinase/tetratricopeptide (TPR) repeat protein
VAAETGTKFGRYEIRSKIGEGGMGEVYLAEDTRLHRKVALKILPTEWAANKDRMRRFEQEAQAAATLNHPNIAHIYEIGESDGVNFIAMEFVDGVTLREKIHQEQTELRKLLRFLQHAAEGLARAHAAGIVHRDLKPDNIMITRDGHAKILDFGLAKLIEQQPLPGSDSSEVATAVMRQHSIPGTVMGTVGYMSPEQAQGKTNEIDQRSDIFSFGCILYEAVTGKKPFEGDSVVKSLHMVIYESAPAIAELNPSAPADLQRIVRRCLAKDPDERYQSIKEVAIELKELRRELQGAGISTTVTPPTRSETTTSTGGEGTRSQSLSPTTGTPSLSNKVSSAEYVATGIRQHKLAVAISLVVVVAGITATALYRRARNSSVAIQSIAVMPFVNESGNADLEYLSDGMTETLINSLSQIPNLSVKARSSVFRYKGKEIDPKKIASELGVEAILTGHVVQRGDQLTLSVELIDGLTENTIWGNKYERKGSDLVSLQSEVARDVSGKLRSKIPGADAAKVEKSFTTNPEAYQLYLKGIFYWNKRTRDSVKRSIDLFNQAIEKDPAYALAYTGLAKAYVLLPAFYASTPQDSYPKAKAAAKRALELDGSLAEAHAALAAAFDLDFDFPDAEQEYKQAIQMSPNYATAHQWYARMLVQIKRYDEAVAEGKRAQELDPLSLIITENLSDDYFFQGKYDEALQYAKATVDMDQNFFLGHLSLGTDYEMKGNYTVALTEYQRVMELNDDPNYLTYLAHLYAASGKRDQALKTLEQMNKITNGGRYISHYGYAVAYAGLGDKDKAIEQLERSFEERGADFLYVAVDPFFKDLHSDPRFVDLMRRAGLPE